jgi:hypothetical protein
MRCSEATADGGPAPSIAYVSENAPKKAPVRIGFSPPPRYLLESAAGKIFDRRSRPAAIAVLRNHPEEPLAQYWLAVALELDGNRSGARVLFAGLAQSPLGPDWVRRWSMLRMADIAVAEGHAADARRSLSQALADTPPTDVDFLRFADHLRRALEWLERHPSP